jgi:hypothetical protein
MLLSHGSGEECAQGILGKILALLGENIPILSYRKQPLFSC